MNRVFLKGILSTASSTALFNMGGSTYAFLTYASRDQCDTAIAKLNGSFLPTSSTSRLSAELARTRGSGICPQAIHLTPNTEAPSNQPEELHSQEPNAKVVVEKERDIQEDQLLPVLVEKENDIQEDQILPVVVEKEEDIQKDQMLPGEDKQVVVLTSVMLKVLEL